MKIVALVGSPRKGGSTARLVGEMLKAAEERNAEIKTYQLNELDISGCRSCYACDIQPTVTCVIRDDVNRILADIFEADGVIFGTPVLMASMSGQMKTMLDRMFPFARKDNTSKMLPGKKVIWAVTQRNPDPQRYMPVFETLVFPMKFLGFSETRIFIAAGTPDLEHLMKQEERLKDAYNLGGWLTE